ncbi:MAG: FxLYD domain-containing protein [Candidatus Rokuibacteriota bacterium]
MSTSTRALVLAAGVVCALVAGAGAQDLSGPSSPLLRPDWTVEPARGGGAHVVGYLYNRNIKDAANVWLRVDRLGADGAVAGTYRRRVVGDVLAGNRSLFDVPVGEAGATYRVAVETVDWVKECR